MVDVIAAGGFGTVYQARHRSLGRNAAIKVLHPEVAGSEAVVRRFEQEAWAVNQIRHPHVVDIYDIGNYEGQPYLVMELLEGEDLEAKLGRDGRLPPEDTLQVLQPLADALDASHGAGVVHRDIKASNVFMGPKGRVVLVDFGIAKLLNADGRGLTSSHHVLGTPTSMAPEQITGGDVDARTDVYALAALTYHMLTGKLLFDATSHLVVQHMHLYSAPPAPSSAAPLTERVDAVLLRALSKEPSDRHDSAGAFVAALGHALTSAENADVNANGIGICVSAVVDPVELANPDNALIDDLDQLLDLAVSELAAAKFVPGLQTGSEVVFVRAGADGLARQQAVSQALALRTAIDTRDGRDPRVHVNVLVHAAPVQLAGDRVMGGALTRMGRRVANGRYPGVVATATLLEDCAISATALTDGLFRLGDPD